jgi:hypothetical protein
VLPQIRLPACLGRGKIETAIEDCNPRNADQRLERGDVDGGIKIHVSSLARR